MGLSRDASLPARSNHRPWRAFPMMLLLLGFSWQTHSQTVRGRITFIAGDAVYASIGRLDGVRDSTLLFVFQDSDTTAVLKVFATSSRSSVSNIVQMRRPVTIGDSLIAQVVSIPEKTRSMAQSEDPMIAKERQSDSSIPLIPKSPPPLPSLRGRIGLQYLTYVQSAFSFTQPGVVVNLRGAVSNSPMTFEVYGNVRSFVRGTQSPVSSMSRNQSRIYRLSVTYDDGNQRLSLGRVIPASAPSIGYIDGMMFVKRVNSWDIGGVVGFEPSFSQRGVSSEFKKVGVFSAYQVVDILQPSASVSYSRTYHRTRIDREVVGMMILGSPISDMYLSGQSEFDLREKSGHDYILRPHVSNTFATVNYRFHSMFSAGIGYGAYRPSYSFSSVRTTPDSLLERQIHSSLNLSGNAYLPMRTVITNTYSPRSSDDGFGREYANYSAISIANMLDQGISARVALNIGATRLTRTRGYTMYVQKSVSRAADISLRYQTQRTRIGQFSEITSNQTIGFDLMLLLFGDVTGWISLERSYGTNADGHSVFAEMSVRL
jgi:hypothetical protein